MRVRSWIPMALLALMGVQCAVWLMIVNATQARLDAGTRERLPMIAKALRDDALCVELHAERSVPAGTSFYLLTPSQSEPGITDTLADYHVVSSDRLAAVRLPQIPLELPCAVDIDVRFRFMMPPGTMTDTSASGLREELAEDLSTALWTSKGAHRLKVLDTLLLARAVHDQLLMAPLDKAEYAVVDTVTGQVLHASAGADLHTVINEGYKQPIFTRDQPGMALALLVYFPGERASIMWNELPWLVGLLALMGLLVFGVRQYVRSAREQRKLARMQMDLVSNITHEFNTPITNIALALETLKKSPTSGSRISNDQLWDIIHVENKRLHANIRRVLDVSMLEGRQMILEPEVHDVHALLTDALEGFGPAITREGAKVTTHFEAMNPWARVDATYMGNMFQALIDNALKYGGSGVHIQLRTEDRGDGVVIEISDDGPGIAREEHEMIFEKFYRIRRTDRYAVKGTGIGLYYARQVIEAHGGSIRVANERKKGSCFRIHLPVEGISHAALARS